MSSNLIEFDGDKLNDPTALSIIISSFICFFVYIPLSMYYGYKFYLHHSHMVFSKRYSKITLYEIILMIIKIIWVPVEHLSEYYFKSHHKSLEHQFILLGNIILAYFILYCWVWRQWLSSYDINLTSCIVNNQWRIYIDPEFEESQLTINTKWYLQNKHRYGNYLWVRNRLFIIAIICILITFFALFLASEDQKLSHDDKMWFYMACICLIPYFSPMVFLIIIYKWTPKFEDNYFIQQELKYIFIALSIMYTSYGITFIYLSLGIYPSNTNYLILILSLENNIVIFCQFSCLMIATCWVNYKMEQVIDTNSYQKVCKSYLEHSSDGHTSKSKSMTQSLLNDGLELVQVAPIIIRNKASSVISNSASSVISYNKLLDDKDDNNNNNNNNNNQVTLQQVLSHIKSFELYMVHLSREFSLECLLSTIEFIEYQKLIYNLINLSEANHDDIEDIKGHKFNGNDNKLWCNIIKLPEHIPKSAIVYGDARGNNRVENCKIKAWALYTKYICVNSDFEINIPGEMRSRYKRLMKNYHEWINENQQYDLNKLLLLFDPLIEQMMSLMTDSFRRFAETKEFLKLTNLMLLR